MSSSQQCTHQLSGAIEGQQTRSSGKALVPLSCQRRRSWTLCTSGSLSFRKWFSPTVKATGAVSRAPHLAALQPFIPVTVNLLCWHGSLHPQPANTCSAGLPSLQFPGCSSQAADLFNLSEQIFLHLQQLQTMQIALIVAPGND